MKHHFAADMHGAKEIRWFIQTVSRDLPKQTWVSFNRFFLGMQFIQSHQTKGGDNY